MKTLLLTTTAALLLASPVLAANTALILWNGSAVETATGIGSADLAASNLNGITVTLSFVSRSTSPNQLTEGNINIDNTTNMVETLHLIAGANGYLGDTSGFDLTGTVGVTSGKADFAGDYFVDGTDSLNGQVESVVGTSVNTFDSTQLTGPKSFSFNGFGSDHVTGPYGLAEELTLTLQPGASVFVQGASMTAIPEPRTWFMLAAGFGLMGLVGWRRKQQRLALS